MAPNFVATVAEIITEYKVDPQLLILEITESAFVSDPIRAFLVLTELKRIGVQLALDDFGTGYSSLSYLKQFPVDIVKLDQTFIADLSRDATSHAIVLKIIELAHLLKLHVVSEGIETAEQAAEIQNLESEYCQGYYFSLPLNAGQLDRLMRRSSAGTNPCLPLAPDSTVPASNGSEPILPIVNSPL
jgi:EAL domain-containing protein (putative c-di-GMP-specific phosphodiesterase class I)